MSDDNTVAVTIDGDNMLADFRRALAEMPPVSAATNDRVLLRTGSSRTGKTGDVFRLLEGYFGARPNRAARRAWRRSRGRGVSR